MYDFNFIINGKTSVVIISNNFQDAEEEAMKLFGYKMNRIELSSIVERS